MIFRRTSVVWLLAGLLTGCGGGGGSSPTSPTPPASTAPTRIVSVTGNLAFGEVAVGASRDLAMTITNLGNAALTVTSLSVSGGLVLHTTATFTSGTIAAGGSQPVTIRFAPTAEGNFSSTITVNGDQTSGTNTIAISGSAISALTGTWAGAHVITACNGTGSVQDLICSAARGSNKVGSSLGFSLTLTQSGNTVTGTANIGGPTGPVTGVVSNGVLSLTGTLRDNQGFTSVINAWSTTTSGGTMSGTLGYTLTFTGVPGNAGIVASLANVTRR